MKVEICVTGFSHDGITWPNCKIIANGQVYIDTPVTNSQNIVLNILDSKSQHLEILQYGKMFGENRVWHTQSANDKVGGDRYLLITDIKFDDVSIKKIWHNGFLRNTFNDRQLSDFEKANIEIPDIESIPQGYHEIRISYNGGYVLDFTCPVYDWIIMQQAPLMRIEGKMKESSLTSIVNWRLDYTTGNTLFELYNECKQLLEKVK